MYHRSFVLHWMIGIEVEVTVGVCGLSIHCDLQGSFGIPCYKCVSEGKGSILLLFAGEIGRWKSFTDGLMYEDHGVSRTDDESVIHIMELHTWLHW